MFELLKTEGKARRGIYHTAHGTVQTPVFMNVGTQAAIKGALSADDIENIGCQVELSNTLKDIASAYEGVAVADINSMHNWILERKDYCDMTGNNVNHPSDFLVRLYAQIILSQLI